MPDYHPGQVWTYKTREGEEGSRVIICKVETLSGGKAVIHVYITGVRVETPYSVEDKIIHMPMWASAVDQSVLDLVSEDVEIPDYHEGYNDWKREYEKGKAGYFSLTIAECVDLIEEAINKGEPAF